MLKNINTNEEYEILDQVNFLDESEELKTTYTIIINGETVTIDLPNEDWEII